MPALRGAASRTPAGPAPSQEYEVYVNTPPTKRTLLLSYAHKKTSYLAHPEGGEARTGHENPGYQPRPLRLRIKPSAGLVEVDLPLYAPSYYDKTRARQFAQVLRKNGVPVAAEHGAGGGFGSGSGAGGSLGLTGAKGLAGSKFAEGKKKEPLDVDDEDAEGGLQFLTLGGKVEITSDHDATYMIGVFKDRELHLTPVDAVCTLRPHFHHLDAQADQERTTGRGGGGGGSTGDHGTHDSEARAVNMAVKSTDDEELDMGEVGRTLRGIQEEQWQELTFVDEEDGSAVTVFGDELQLQDEEARGARLVSALTERQYREIAGAPRIEPMNQGRRVLSTRLWSDADDAVEEAELEEAKPVVSGTAKRKAPAVKQEPDAL